MAEDKIDYLQKAKDNARWFDSPGALAQIALVERVDAILDELRAKPRGEVAVMGLCGECKHMEYDSQRIAACCNNTLNPERCANVKADFGCVLWEERED